MGAVAAPGLAPKRARRARSTSGSRAARSRSAERPAGGSAERRARARSGRGGHRRRATTASGIVLLPFTMARRTAGAVSGLADTSVMVRLTQSRAWIALLAALLGGIVALNLFGLGLSSSVSKTAAVADQLERDNSLLREQISTVGTRRSARAADRATLPAAAVAVEPASEALPADIVPASDVVPLEAPPVEAETPPAAVESSGPPAGQAPAAESTGGGAVSAGGVGSP